MIQVQAARRPRRGVSAVRAAVGTVLGAAAFALVMAFLGGDGAASVLETGEHARMLFLIGVVGIVAVGGWLARHEARRG